MGVKWIKAVIFEDSLATMRFDQTSGSRRSSAICPLVIVNPHGEEPPLTPPPPRAPPTQKEQTHRGRVSGAAVFYLNLFAAEFFSRGAPSRHLSPVPHGGSRAAFTTFPPFPNFTHRQCRHLLLCINQLKSFGLEIIRDWHPSQPEMEHLDVFLSKRTMCR